MSGKTRNRPFSFYNPGRESTIAIFYWNRIKIKSWNDFIQRDYVAPMRKVYPPAVRRAKIPIPVAPPCGIFDNLQDISQFSRKSSGFLDRSFATIMILIYYLNSSRAAPINRDLRQAAGNSNLNVSIPKDRVKYFTETGRISYTVYHLGVFSLHSLGMMLY